VPVQVVVDSFFVEAFCRKWKVAELSLFGSALTDEYRADSDIDILIAFEPDSGLDILDFVDMKAELERYFGRDVDLVDKDSLTNPFRRSNILKTRRVIYAAG